MLGQVFSTSIATVRALSLNEIDEMGIYCVQQWAQATDSIL